MFVICVQRDDGFSSAAGDREAAQADTRWSSLVDAACRSAEGKRLTACLTMYEAEAPNETAAVAAVRAGMGRELKSIRILPPPDVARKVTIGGPGAVTPERLEQAQKAIEAEAAAYPDRARGDLRALQELVARMAAEGCPKGSELEAAFLRRVYEIKGQGGTFGYPSMTAVAHHLYLMGRARDLGDPRIIEAIKVHIDTMSLILKGRITGTTEEGRMIVGRLHDVVVKMIGKPEA